MLVDGMGGWFDNVVKYATPVGWIDAAGTAGAKIIGAATGGATQLVGAIRPQQPAPAPASSFLPPELSLSTYGAGGKSSSLPLILAGVAAAGLITIAVVRSRRRK